MIPGVRPIVDSAEEWPEVPGAMVRVQPEGGLLPAGHWRVLSRVIRRDWRSRPPHTPSGLAGEVDHGWGPAPLDLLLVAPLPSQHWWERSVERRLRPRPWR